MKKRSKNRNELVFDNKKREEFLKGFSKRKKQRQKKAQEEIEQKLKEERKKIKEEAKNLKEKFKHSFRPIDDLKDIVSDESEDEGEQFETDEVKVVVKSLDLPRKKCINESSDEEKDSFNSEMVQQNENDLCHIKGMEMEEEEDKSETQKKSNIFDQFKIGSKKDLKRLIDKHTKTAMKKNKVLEEA
ncbi:hypothetical protein PVAND_011480 [Polypedilum vanderplanki]|uniref:Nucleolar protein 12 n=1 Tax=Polypedilum vanderplanki TaxID=319348 RepID=A0A9J6CJG1_POLVA|nr:hypothetical protein PVAND_011480 [Polypedilum vanderplanki]